MSGRSVFWQYFVKEEKLYDRVKWTLCNKIVITNRNTTNMKNHIAPNHPFIYRQLMRETKKGKIPKGEANKR